MVTSKVIMRRANVRFTYSDYLLLPEDKRYEILDGELFVIAAPKTKHQKVSLQLTVALYHYVRNRELGQVLQAPFDVILSEENVVQPDIIFVRKERIGIIGEANLQGAPDLVIEILSPGTRSKDLELKRKIYCGFAVQEYWIVDPDLETIEVLILGEERYLTTAVYAKSQCLSSPLLPDLDLPLSQVFC